MSDLETRIREALHADEIGWDDLRQPTPPGASHPPRHWPTLLATAAAVAVVATVASLIAVTRGSPGPAAAPVYAGYTWQVTAVTERRGPIPDVASVPAQFAFSDTAVSATLSGASIFGHYRTTSDGYHLTDLGIAEIAPGISVNAARMGSAIGRLFLNDSQRGFASSNLASVAARVSGDRLVLQANGVTIRLSRVGPSQLSPIIDAVGYNWRVDALTDEHGRLTIPHQLHATVGFAPDGLLGVEDTVNRFGARYGLSGDGYLVGRRVSGTPGEPVGLDPVSTRLIAAVDAMMQKGVAVTATVKGDTMTLHRGPITLTLHRGARMRYLSQIATGRSSGGGTASAPTSAAPVISGSSLEPAPPKSVPARPVSPGRGSPGSHH